MANDFKWNGSATSLAAPTIKGYGDSFKPLTDQLTRLSMIENRKKEISDGQDFLVQRETWKNQKAEEAASTANDRLLNRDYIQNQNRVDAAKTLNDNNVTNATTLYDRGVDSARALETFKSGESSKDREFRLEQTKNGYIHDENMVGKRASAQKGVALYTQGLKDASDQKKIDETSSFLKSIGSGKNDSSDVPTMKVKGSDIQVFDQKTFNSNASKEINLSDKIGSRMMNALNSLPKSVSSKINPSTTEKEIGKIVGEYIGSNDYTSKSVANDEKSKMTRTIKSFISDSREASTLGTEISKKRKSSTIGKSTYNTVTDYSKNGKLINGRINELVEQYALAPTKMAKDVIKTKISLESKKMELNQIMIDKFSNESLEKTKDSRKVEIEKDKEKRNARINSIQKATDAYNKANGANITAKMYENLSDDKKSGQDWIR